MLRHTRNVHTVNEDVTFIGIEDARNAVHQSGLARTVGADDRDKVSFFERQIDAAKRFFLVRSVREKGLMKMSDLKHRLPPNVS